MSSAPDDPPAAMITSYDRVAEAYADRFLDELGHKPLDRALLALFADDVRKSRGAGRVLDVGCGPGQIARHLRGMGVDVAGLDASPGMVAIARRVNPDLTIHEGSFFALPAPDRSLAGITAFYAYVHLAPDALARAFVEAARALERGGLLLTSYHVGAETLHVDTLLGARVDLDFVLFDTDHVLAALESAGFQPETQIERVAYTAVEHPTTRGYVVARKR